MFEMPAKYIFKTLVVLSLKNYLLFFSQVVSWWNICAIYLTV